MAGPRGVPRGPVFCNGPVTQATRFLIEATIRGDMEVTVTTTTTRNPLVYVAAGAVAFIGLIAVIAIRPASTAAKTTGTFTVAGVYALTEAYPNTAGTCSASGDHAAYVKDEAGELGPVIKDGAWVGIYDSSYKLLAKTHLEPGRWQPAYGVDPLPTCRWRFTLEQVPVGEGIYLVEVGQRGFGGEVNEQQLRQTAAFLDDVPRA